MDIKALLQNLDLKSIPCEYCDVRVEETFETKVQFLNHEMTSALEQSSKGAFLRVKKQGQWYYSATTDFSDLRAQLLKLAESSILGIGDNWQKLPGNNGTYENLKYGKNNPTSITLSEKVELQKKYDQLIKANSFVKSSSSKYVDFYKIKTYSNSEGTFFQYDFAQYGVAAVIDLADGDKKFNDYSMHYADSFEDLKKFEKQMVEDIESATQFLYAPLIEPGKYKVLLSPEVTGVFVHESFGHMSEADSMMGDAKAKEAWALGKKVAADFISIVDSGKHDGSGYCPIDDEGYLATKTYLVKEGLLSGRLHSYDTADTMTENPTGNGRAINFEFEPIVRMTSTYIENGSTPLAELYKKAEGGLLIQNFSYGTGGDLFTIAPQRMYLIEDGKPKKAMRANVMSGQLFQTLLNIEAIGNDFELHHSAFGGCGKQMQFPLPVSDGGPTILVKDMQVS